MINGQHIVSENAMKQRTVKAIIALSLWLAAGAIHAECPPSLIGSPCAFGGLASASHIEPGITLGAGNPIHLATGNKYQQDIDLPPSPGMRGLELVRHYNAMDARPSVLGQGWVLSYDTRLHRSARGWHIVQADGSRVDFPENSLNADGTHATRYGQLRHGPDHHEWFMPTGTIIQFDQRGMMAAVHWHNGESIDIARHNETGPLRDKIRTVQNVHGHTLNFHYDTSDQHARLVRVDTPLGSFHYSYDVPKAPKADVSDRKLPKTSGTTRAIPPSARPSHRLVQVTRPDGMQRRYLHEPARQNGHMYALTGITIASSEAQDEVRINSWAYDAMGRAIESISVDKNQVHHQLQLEYQRTPSRDHDGLTVVSDHAGGQTRFHTAIRGHRYVLLSVQGQGCFGCAAPGTQADYDDHGRLTLINGTEIIRTQTGSVRRIRVASMGWPGLSLHYNDKGQRDHWHSSVTSTEHILYSEQGLPIERRFGNGDTHSITYDAQHRPTHIHEQSQSSQSVTRLTWHGHALVHIDHPAESETRHYDDQGRIQQRTIRRPVGSDGRPLEISEAFRYDEHHRLTEHMLPEGGRLQYRWGQGSQIKAIYWQDIAGRKHKILETVVGQAGYRYGNGLHLDTAADANDLVRQLRLRHQDHLIWAQELSYDQQQRITTEHHHLDAPKHPPQSTRWNYAYDTKSRLAGYQQISTDNPVKNPVWLAWQEDGRVAAIRKNNTSHRPTFRRDASGLVSHINGIELTYGPDRRLKSVRQPGKPVVNYQHNAFGYQISRNDSQGARSDYFYLNNQLVAEATGIQSKLNNSDASSTLLSVEPLDADMPAANVAAPGITRRYVYAHHVPVAIIDYSADAPQGQYYAVHADLQGAPRLITDQTRKIRWHADYSPFGEAIIYTDDLRMDLRLPGQVADPDTGWHDNLLRTYMPAWGHYLEPDPLGPVPGNQAYGYASQQPRRYADPMGLLLFAFDGTRQTADTRSNVWKMSQYYLDGPIHYHPGPGNAVFINWDTLTAHQAEQIINTQWQWLLYELSRPQAATEITPIDILGFSRGAALARHFGNMISQHVHQGLFQFNDPTFGAVSACVDLRFMGLFDTVAQFGVAGSQNKNYDLSVTAAWEWVAHAVALHERRWLFPLTAADGSNAANVVEAPFIGAHSDIGGGVLPDSQGQRGGRGDLSDVALNWMVWQARAASVSLGDISSEHGTIEQPILHDFRNPVLRTIQDGDRRVDNAQGQRWLSTQDQHSQMGRQRRAQAERLIQRHDQWRSHADAEVGMVDMDGYAQWLHEELGWHAAPV